MKTQALMMGLAALLAGCAPTSESDGGGSSQFTFSSFDQTTFAITAVDENGAPLQGAAVTVENVYSSTLDDDTAEGHRVYLRGVTNASGVMTGTVRLPNTVARFDVVVQYAGRTGPWTDTALQAELGYFAPSSRQTRDIAAEITMTVPLED
jgi:hypothetical protein